MLRGLNNYQILSVFMPPFHPLQLLSILTSLDLLAHETLFCNSLFRIEFFVFLNWHCFSFTGCY